MKISVIALCVWISVAAQSESLEKQAISIAQQAPVSSLDAELPKVSFGDWFKRVVGPGAGVIWQLSECGERGETSLSATGDIRACVEANATLTDGRRVILMTAVGTFKRGVVGAPRFDFGVIEERGELYTVKRLRDLSEMLRSPKILSELPDLPETLRSPRKILSELPDLPADLWQVTLSPMAANLLAPALDLDSAPEHSKEEEEPPPPPAPRAAPRKVPVAPQKISQGLLEGSVVKRRMPAYPLTARSMNAYGKVEVRIVISEAGQVIEATAISGHPALRTAAVDAAREWVYKSTTLNGVPTKVETILTFTFAPDSQ
jgi:protein TonB